MPQRKDKTAKTARQETGKFEKPVSEAPAQLYVLRLCVSGMTPLSREAVENLKRICEQHLEGQYQLEVIDLYQQPELAAKHQVIATPTLVKYLPTPLRRLIGNLSDTGETLRRLGTRLKRDTGR